MWKRETYEVLYVLWFPVYWKHGLAALHIAVDEMYTTEWKKTGSETVRHSQQAQHKNHVPNSSGPDINHPPVFTTKPGLASQHIDAWEMLTSCWDQCSGLLWPSQGCVVSAELFWRFRWGRDQCIFLCGVFSFPPPTDSVWHRLDTHQGHCCLPSLYGYLFSVK